ncbi:hypothetical protein [Aequorivita echinoideorum]|uniref:UbiA prenyltransferase family protein n=1 Tax=Aequorivita echinoideorum TaxID=1549647 RepID=A0ABS5S2N6_9FLAO|nr:hypothetical protein [Aequorivita echinoideorum]MBT0607472.1 hypothetical protein [Aequorivita echinoideorum]
MKLLRHFFSFYINSSIHVAVAVCSFAIITALEFGFRMDLTLFAFIFFGTISGYNFVKYAKVAGLHHRTLTNSLKTIQVFSFVCFLAFCFFGLKLPLKILAFIAAFGLLTFFYAVPSLKRKNLRSLSRLKIFIVAVVWAGVTVIVPAISKTGSFHSDIWLTFFQRILIVIVLTLPFEIRDVRYDALSLKTFPQQIGIGKTKYLGIIFLGISLLLETFKENFSFEYFTALLIFCVILAAVLAISKTEQHKYFSSFWVEGLPIFWLLIYCLLLA